MKIKNKVHETKSKKVKKFKDPLNVRSFAV